MIETQLSKSIGDFLSLNRVKNWRCGSFSGHLRGFGKKKSYIVKVGIVGLSDRQFLLSDMSGRTVYLEIKPPGKKQSKGQLKFEADCIKLNVPYYVASSIADVAEILDLYGMLKVKI